MASNFKVEFPSKNPLGNAEGVILGDINKTEKGVIVIHEWWGLNPQIQDEAKEIAEEGGFLTLVPDFYRGKVASDSEQAGHLMGNLNWQGALQDITAASEYLKSLGCKKIGVTGFCMGGALTFAAAAKCPEISAAAPFYGIPSTELADLTTIKIPVQMHFGKQDALTGFSSPDDYLPLKDKLIKAGVNLEFFDYDAGHAFTNKTGPLGNYNEEYYKLSFSRMYRFFQKYLC